MSHTARISRRGRAAGPQLTVQSLQTVIQSAYRQGVGERDARTYADAGGEAAGTGSGAPESPSMIAYEAKRCVSARAYAISLISAIQHADPTYLRTQVSELSISTSRGRPTALTGAVRCEWSQVRRLVASHMHKSTHESLTETEARSAHCHWLRRHTACSTRVFLLLALSGVQRQRAARCVGGIGAGGEHWRGRAGGHCGRRAHCHSDRL